MQTIRQLTIADNRVSPAPSSNRRSRDRMADLLEALAVSVVTAVIVLFLLNDGGNALFAGDSASRLIAMGRLTGLVGTALLLIQLLLAARLPWVDRTYGHDRALVAHRRISRVGLPLLVAHALALILGYAAQDGLSPLTGWLVEPIRMLGGSVPDMLTAFVAMGILIVVAVTSIQAARRRWSHEAWHVVHATAYAGVAFSLPHQLSAGTDIAGHPLTRLVWMGLYAATAGAVVIFRALQPLWRTLLHRPRVTSVIEEAPGVVSIVVTGRHLDRLPIRAGQFLHWRFLTPGLWAAAHPWSISAAPDGRHLRITVRDLGDHSRRVAALKLGTRVVIEGPYGAFTTDRRSRRKVLLIAAGIGITPIRALAEELAVTRSTSPDDVTLLYRSNDEKSLIFREELDWMNQHSPIRVSYLIGPPARGSWLPPHGGPSGPDADASLIGRLVSRVDQHDVYVCGPPPWMTLVRESLLSAGVPKKQIHDERFGW